MYTWFKFKQLFHTVKYLKFQQIYFRLWYRFTKPKLPPIKLLPLAFVAKKWQRFIEPAASLQGNNEIILLNQKADISSANCWCNPYYDLTWRYNLHYFDDVNAQNNHLRYGEHVNLMMRWIQENPVGTGRGWDAYPLSLRMINWIKWALAGNTLREEMQLSLVTQTYFLEKRLEWHLLGNHVLVNAKALIFAGCFFSGVEATRWLDKGLKIVAQQLPEQILADGGHFELSPMYQAKMIEDLLDLVQLFQLYQKPIPHTWKKAIETMLAWLQAMLHADGAIAFFNDATFSMAPSWQELKHYYEALYACKCHAINKKMVYLAESGYVRMQHHDAVLIADIGQIGPDYLPGHAHADTLSFELSLWGARFLVNSGISTYYDVVLRQEQRSTKAHNSVVIDGQNSSEVWGQFRVAERARVFGIKTNENQLSIEASHDGYRRLKGKPIHTRKWQLDEKSLVITDTISGLYQHDVSVFFHFAPGLILHVIDEHNILILNAAQNKQAQLRVNYPIKVEEGFFYPEFNKAIANQKIVIALERVILPIMIETWLIF